MSLLVLLVAGANPSHAGPKAVVSRIDHFVVEDSQAEGLFKILSEQFQLPTIWPMAGYGSSRSGGLYFGNVVVEVGHYGNAADAGHAQWAGIVFAPRKSASESAAQLDERHIDHGPPVPYLTKAEGGEPAKLLWTTVRVRDALLAEVGAVICEYHFDTKSGLEAAAMELGRKNGGPLGLLGVEEVLVEIDERTNARERWTKLLSRATVRGTDNYEFASGPAIHLVPGTHNEIRLLTLEVRTLNDARTFLSNHGIAYDVHDGLIELRDGVHGLAVRIAQRR